jgi:hypothetical protein
VSKYHWAQAAVVAGFFQMAVGVGSAGVPVVHSASEICTMRSGAGPAKESAPM